MATKGKPAPPPDDEDTWPERRGRGAAVSDAERAEMLRRVQAGEQVTAISRDMGRSRQCIYAFLATIKATGHLAKAEAEADAARLSRVMRQKVEDQGDAKDALEVLDRLDVLPKKRDPGAGGHSQTIVMVGMPGQPALVPPSQQEIVTIQQRVLAEKAHG